MITRTTIGADFEGALTYGAGVRQGDTPKKQAELIGSSNLGDVSNPRGLAAEMQSVADERNKCKNPVWHTSLSWAKGEQLSTAQKLKAATLYCELLRSQLRESMPADERAAYSVWEQHQVAVYEHHDKDHDHIHIYINRVPLDGGAAIETGRNYKFNLKAIKIITQELGLNPLPSQRQSFKDSRPPVQDTRQVVRAALVEAMADPQVQSLAQLQERLTAQGIEARLKRSAAGALVGVSFKQGAAAVTGQEVGFKAAQLRAHYEPAQRQAQDQVPQPVAAPLVPEVASSPTQPAGPAQVPQPVAADVVQRLEQLMVEQLRQQQQVIPFLTAVAKQGFRFVLKPDGVGVFVEQASGAEVPSLALKPSGRPWTDQVQVPPQQPAVQLVPVVQQPKLAAPEQRPVAAQPPAPELKPPPAAPAVKPEPLKQAPPKKKGRKIS